MIDTRPIAVVLTAASLLMAARALLSPAPASRPVSAVPTLIGWAARQRIPAGWRVGPAPPRALLARAGWERDVDAAGLARAQTVLGLVALVAVVMVAWWGPALALVAPFAGAVGWWAPRATLHGHARRRATRMRRQLPDVLDVLGLCADTGMAVDPALRVAVERMRGPLIGELAETLTDIRLGATRRTAYADLVARVALPEMARFVSAIMDAEELGAPLAHTVRAQAARARDDARREAHRAAATAAPKIQLVIAFMMVPAALLMVMAVMVGEMVRQIAPVFQGIA